MSKKDSLHTFLIAALVGSLCWAPRAWGGAPEKADVVEGQRRVPVAYDVDVAVVGGSTGGVNAALAAARAGARVFLAAPRPYLGEDMCGTLRLWLEPGESPAEGLEKTLYTAPQRPGPAEGGLKFQYRADQPTSSRHPDGDPPTVLCDGKWWSATKESVEYGGDVVIEIDLGDVRDVREVHVMAYQRSGDFVVGKVHIDAGVDGKKWERVATVTNDEKGMLRAEEEAIDLSELVGRPARHLRLSVEKYPAAKRILLGEIVVVEQSAERVMAERAPRPPTPMHVKRVLERALIDAGVEFLYQCHPTEALVDRDGRVSGFVMANRAGRQAVRAKVVIDASERSALARLAGAEFRPYPAGPRKFRRVVVGGAARSGEGMTHRDPGVEFASTRGAVPIHDYELTIPMEDGSWRSFARAEQEARDRTYDVGQYDSSEFLYQVPPDGMRGRRAVEDAAADPVTLDLDAARPAGVDGLHVVGGCIDISRGAAERLVRPLGLMRLGARVGAAAAAEARARAIAGDISVRARPVGGARDAGEVREFLDGIRPGKPAASGVAQPAGALPVLGEWDVIVVGGGTGGAPAAIGAARRGAKTLLLEYQTGLGGVGTLGLISIYYHGYREGFTAEIDAGVAAMGGEAPARGWNSQTKSEWYRREVRKAGGEIWYGTIGCGALVAGGKVNGVMVSTPRGRGIALGGSVVDATGGADIAAAAGAECEYVSAEDLAMQGTGLPPRGLGVGYTNTDYTYIDETDMIDVWRSMVMAREKFAGAYDLSTFIDTRERRRIRGDIYVTPLDLVNGRTYPDSVSIHKSNFDSHGYTVHPFWTIRFPDKEDLQVFFPYRAMLPKGLDGVLVTGLGVSAHRDAMPILRMQPCVQNQGYAAGLAAATAARGGKPLRGIDVRALQRELVEKGCLTPDVLEHKDSYPIADAALRDAVGGLPEDLDLLAMVLVDPGRSLPLLRDAYRTAEVIDAKLIYAMVLGMLGDASGVDLLLDQVRAQSWDDGWEFKSGGQFGRSASRLDGMILALGRAGDRRAAPVIAEKARGLEAASAISHHRAVAIALETLRDPAAADALAELLGKPGMTGHAIVEVPAPGNYVEGRAAPIKEIAVARALYRCGDKEGLGERILREYARDLRGVFARHAEEVLK